ncbi:MAG: MarR family winged helix-turn-helix transcriptional regulator [Xanthomonadales bacterium]|nr:MarR family winged helix-turn-helix transcriptional regulator [Xanthomonadales bacterium]
MPIEFDLEQFLPYRLSLLSNRISGDIAESYRDSQQISISDWRIIAVLGQYPNSTATELKHYTAMGKVGISRAVKHLTQRQLVTSENHEHDRRARKLTLTKAGQQLRAEVIPKISACEQKLTSVLTKTEIEKFGEIIDKLLNA